MKIEKQYGRALVQPSTLDKENRTVDVVFATETPVPRFGWDENYDEILQCDPSAVRMDRIEKGLPVIDTHNSYSVSSQFGRTEKVWFDDARQIWARIKFSKRMSVDDLFQDISDGIISEISVGYRVYKFNREPQGENDRPVYRAIDWMPVEISFCSIPADSNSGTRSQENQNEILIIDKNRTMNTPPKTTDSTVEPSLVDIEAIRTAATDGERKRLNDILTSVRAAGLSDSYAIELHTGGKSVEECRQSIIEKVVSQQPTPPQGAHTINVSDEAIDKKRCGIENAILHRADPAIFKLDEGAREFRGMTLVEMAKELLSERGINIRGKDKSAIADIIFGSRTHSTGDFPILLENVVDKMLRTDYAFAPEYWPMIARQISVSDFRAKMLYQVETVNGMSEVPEGKEISYTTLTEGKESIRVKSYAEGIAFTRQAFINDDLGAFSIIPQRFVKDWDEKRGDLVWGIIINNVKMSDGFNLYSTEHKNLLTGTNSVLGETGLADALVKFKRQTGLDGKRSIRVLPKFLYVPAELEVTAYKLMTATLASNTKDVNVFTNKFDVIVEPRLTEPKAWGLLADPAACPCIQYAYLDGQEALRTKIEDDFNTDSIRFAVRGEFGVAAIDYRGTVKSAGK